jgi:murein DD-endopeptidase MepM/ murein hydrolase activator NlpD
LLRGGKKFANLVFLRYISHPKKYRNKKLSKVKYKYNPETLSYDEVELTWRDHLRKVSFHLITALVASVILLAASYNWIKQKGKSEALLNNEQTEAKLQEFSEELSLILAVLNDIQDRDDNIYRNILGAEPFPKYKREISADANQKKYAHLKELDHSELVMAIAKKMDVIEKKLVAQSMSFDSVIGLAKSKEKMLTSIPSIIPISKEKSTLASGFGMRMHPIYKIMKMHTGIDFISDIGVEIYAAGDGKVIHAEWEGGYGQSVIIDHGFGYKTRYAHTSKYNVKPGQKVQRGDVIAYVGNTGASVGPHLHYEVLYKGAQVNPINYFFNDLSPEEFEEITKMAARPTQSM